MHLSQLVLKVSQGRDQVSRDEGLGCPPSHVSPDGDDGEHGPCPPRIGLITIVPLLPDGDLANEPQD